MRANELMIGDIILCDGKVPMKMAHTDRELNVWVNPYDSQAYPYYGYGTCEEYAPIPLTPEILEKNGFERNEPYWWIEDHLLEIYRNEWDGVLCVAGVRGLELNYVHQIQQILRICGLNDLADNFKV